MVQKRSTTSVARSAAAGKPAATAPTVGPEPAGSDDRNSSRFVTLLVEQVRHEFNASQQYVAIAGVDSNAPGAAGGAL